MKITDFLLPICCGLAVVSLVSSAQTIDRRCLNCMCQASSSCNLKLRCHNANDGSYYCGPYQISWAYWADAGKPGSNGFSNDFEKCLTDRTCAERTIAGYMSKWASDCNGDGQIDCLDFAAIHKTGPTSQCNQSWLKNSKYWNDFNRCYASAGPVDNVIEDSPAVSAPSSSSSGFTGSANFPSRNPNHKVVEIDPQPIGSYAISSSDPRPLRASSNLNHANLESISPVSVSVPSVSSFVSDSGSGHTTHYSSSSSYSNYSEVTEEVSGNVPLSTSIDNSNLGFESSIPQRSPLPASTVYESHRSSHSSPRIVEDVAEVEQPALAPVSHHNFQPTTVAPRVIPNYAPIPPTSAPTASVSGNLKIQEFVPSTCMSCLCQASSKCNINKGCEGAYCGPFLLSWAYWTDGGKPGFDYPTCANNYTCAGQAVHGYMNKWTRDCNGDGVVDCTDFGLIHKLGPHGCHKLEALKSTEYWNRFESCYAPQPRVTETVESLPPVQPIADSQPDVYAPSSNTASRSVASEPVGRRNDFIEQPLSLPLPQPFSPPRSRNSNPVSNIRISFGNREIVNTAVSDGAIIHPTPASPFTSVPAGNSFARPTAAPLRPIHDNFNSRVQEYPPRRDAPRAPSAFASDVISENPRASDYISSNNNNNNNGYYSPSSGSNIREVPANNDNSGFDDNSFSGRSATPEEVSPPVEPSNAAPQTGFNPFAPLNKTEELVSQECLNCMCHAATRCDESIGCKSDSTGKFVCGAFQVDWQYWSDAGKPGNRADLSNLENFQMCLNNRQCADETIRGYMQTHQIDCNGDGRIDCSDYAALHVVGAANCRAKWYLESKYFADFKECISF